MLIAIILITFIVFRYELSYRYALKSIPYEKIVKDGSIIISQDLDKLKEVIAIQYNSELFKTSNQICIVIFTALTIIFIMIKEMCKCKNCKKQISINYIFKLESFECPYCKSKKL